MEKGEVKVLGADSLKEGSCRVVAEAGVNHSNSVERAILMAESAAKAGAWAIKFQLYKASRLSIRDSPKYWSDQSGTQSQFETFERGDKLEYDDYAPVAEACRDLGIAFFATPFDPYAVEAMERLDVPLYKVASGDITHKPLLEEIARTGKPVLLSTGASTGDEVERALSWLGAVPSRVVILVCTLSYPTDVKDAHFARLERFRQEYSPFMVGMSDHTLGVAGGWMAAALGAVCIEKHYTLDKTLTDVPDHRISLDPPELAALVKACDQSSALRGSNEIKVFETEAPARANARRSIVASRDLQVGDVLSADDLDFKRPGTGIPPFEIDAIIGKKVLRDIPYDSAVSKDDLA